MQLFASKAGNVRSSSVIRSVERAGDRFAVILFGHFDLFFTVFIATILFAAILDPILAYLGLDVVAKPVFNWMHLLCAQTPSHSFYLFGHQICLCERCLAIYSAMVLGSLTFGLSKKRLRGLPWWGWLLCTLPMAYDGLTQLFGLRESTWELRLITGGLFGLSTILFVLPLMQKTVDQTRS